MENLLMKTMVSRGTRHSLATRGRRWAENSQILLVCITQEHKVQTTNWPGEVIKKKKQVWAYFYAQDCIIQLHLIHTLSCKVDKSIFV